MVVELSFQLAVVETADMTETADITETTDMTETTDITDSQLGISSTYRTHILLREKTPYNSKSFLSYCLTTQVNMATPHCANKNQIQTFSP
ncbi:hypothetical protein [Nostoc sp.]|uniref:hypothetical protein n=1 Tax=Nostoc sp. TaxID=1180 RepID=UPI002FF6ED6A